MSQCFQLAGVAFAHLEPSPRGLAIAMAQPLDASRSVVKLQDASRSVVKLPDATRSVVDPCDHAKQPLEASRSVTFPLDALRSVTCCFVICSRSLLLRFLSSVQLVKIY